MVGEGESGLWFRKGMVFGFVFAACKRYAGKTHREQGKSEAVFRFEIFEAMAGFSFLFL